MGYQTIGEDGHYKFTDVILFQGRNEFVLKFYGPSGQVEEKTEYINVGANPGDGSNLFYTFSVSQPDRKVYEIGDDKLRAESADDVYQATLLTRYSFGRAFGLQAGIQETRGEIYRDETNSTGTDIDDILSQKEEPEGEVANQYYSLEMHTGFDAHTFSITAAKQNNRDVSYLYRLGGNIGRTVYRIDFNQYGAFTDTLATNPVNNLYGLSLTQRFKRGAAVLRMNRLENEKRYSDEYRLGVSGSVSRVNWSNSLLYENTVYADVSHQPDVGEASEDAESLSGAFIVSTSLSSFIARFTTSYDVIPNNQLSKVNLSTSYRLYPKAKLNFDFSHSLNTNNNRYRLGLNWQLNEFHITPSVLYSSDGQWQGQVQLSTSLGKRTGRLGSYYDMASDPSMSKGSVRARLFEDQNFDGQYQIGEPLLSGGEIKAVHARRRGKSNSAGVAWLDAVQSWKLTDIEVDSNTIDAGAMTLSRDPFSLVARPGKVVEIDLPFNRVGALDGTVFDSIDGILTPAWGISVVINDENGEVVDKQVTDTNGYFDFSKLLFSKNMSFENKSKCEKRKLQCP